ncbi:MAG: hypothetical protein ACK5XV_03980 [Flavobacteriales bacterium]
MHTKMIAVLGAALLTASALAQDAPCQMMYFGLGTGLESPTGLAGVTLEAGIGKHLAAEAAAGLSGWGGRYGAGVKIYLDECRRGFAFGAGYSRSSGLPEIELDMEVEGGDTERVTMEYLPQDNIQLSIYKYWSIKQRTRFHLQAGYSVNISAEHYRVLSEHQLSSFSKDVMKLTTPGGFMLAAGFSFGL